MLVLARLEGAGIPPRLPQSQRMPAWQGLCEVALPVLPFRIRPKDSAPLVVQTLPKEPPLKLLPLQFLHIQVLPYSCSLHVRIFITKLRTKNYSSSLLKLLQRTKITNHKLEYKLLLVSLLHYTIP